MIQFSTFTEIDKHSLREGSEGRCFIAKCERFARTYDQFTQEWWNFKLSERQNLPVLTSQPQSLYPAACKSIPWDFISVETVGVKSAANMLFNSALNQQCKCEFGTVGGNWARCKLWKNISLLVKTKKHLLIVTLGKPKY